VAKTFAELVAGVLPHIKEMLPWDLVDQLEKQPDLLVVDIREPAEYAFGAIANSLNVPRGILETACDWGYDTTVPRLANAREQSLVLVCRSGNRTAMAAYTLQLMGYQHVYSLKTGIRGWNDYEQPLINAAGERVDIDEMDTFLNPPIKSEQKKPN
jgi:rhodanese-related sulfurtransferase